MRNLPTVTKNLLLANIIVFLLTAILQRAGIHLNMLLGMHLWSSPYFHFWQPLTYMFCHADFSHILCNMFAVWMFGPVLEREWGERRYLLYYLVCGLGAALVQQLMWMATGVPMGLTIGASGAVFGILFAFGWLFPDVPMYLLFVPVPIRARTFVLIYAAIELAAGLGNVAGISGGNIAHFAHLGGMLFGWLMLLYWRNWGDAVAAWWRKLKRKNSKYTRLDSSEDKDYSNYHYQQKL